MLHNTLLHVYIYFPIFELRSKIPRTIESFVGRWSPLSPQVSDDANLGILGYLGGISLYIFYAVFADKWKQFRSIDREVPEEIIPQSEEIKEMTMDNDTLSQNVKFIDTHPGYGVEAKGEFDSLRDAPMTGDASLEEFFSRPLRIFSRDWGVNTTLYNTFNPWQLYWENNRVINRIANYKLLRAKLHLKVTINGNAFHYGRAILSYNPLPGLDEMTVDRAFIDADNVAASQRPHIYLDPTNSQGGEMVLPFFYHKNALDIVGDDWRELGECVLNGLTTLKHANGAVDTVTINVFAWATDVKFAIPTQTEPGEISPQADEYGQGIISKPASVVANIASKLTSVPAIAPFARATEIGGNAIAAVASLFGYSRPVMLEKCQYKPHVKGDLAITDGEDDVQKLSVTGKQELTLDPRTTGLSDQDELVINYIAARESYLTDFPWQVGTGTETLLWNAVVDPCLHRIQGNELHFPACCYAAMPFDYWRGSMEFRFQVVCSGYHKGRLKVVYDPTGNFSGGAEYNTAYTTVVDIADTTDFTVKCGWGQALTYRRHFNTTTTESNMFSTSPLTYSSPGDGRGNGTIAVYVVNELTVPNTTDNNDIEINVFVKMCDDFEVAQPTYRDISTLRTTTQTNLTAPQAFEVLPHAEGEADVDNDNDETNRMDSAPMGTKVVNTTGNEIAITDYTNHVHFGESIRSFRQLIKRYNLHELLTVKGEITDGAKLHCEYVRNLLPFEPGYTSDNNDVTLTTFNGFYYYSQMTLLRYLTLGYGGWRGGVRWLVDSSTVSDSRNFLEISRGKENRQMSEFFDDVADTGTIATVSNTGVFYNRMRVENGMEGACFTNTDVNPTLSVEVPYYSQYRFAPGKERVKAGTGVWNTAMPTWTTLFVGDVNSNDYLTTWCAAAEDFNCFFYLGPPIFYKENSYPTT